MRNATLALSLVLFVLALPVNGCGGTQEPPTGIPPGADLVPIQQLPSFPRQYSAIEEPRRTVIRDETTWATFWAEIEGLQTPKTDPPPVDFTTQLVLAAAMGTRSTGGHTITIERVYRTSDRIFVEVREVAPGRACIVTMALTQPVDAALAPKSELPVSFVERKEVRDCR
ncbi:MAG: protease complex subunit PrcB family protein [Gemmatimonadetes bacterium]|nr:protease complex subunit PrcB family protein [Gemmatimonadota bacterium]